MGDGTLSVARTLPVGTWLVVTASNALGEGPAGTRSDGVERGAVTGWEECGAGP